MEYISPEHAERLKKLAAELLERAKYVAPELGQLALFSINPFDIEWDIEWE